MTKHAAKLYARLDDVGVRYGPKVVMQNLSLDIVEGAITCIIGLSGAGKSTILRLLNGLRTPDAGRVFVRDRRHLRRCRERELIEIRRNDRLFVPVRGALRFAHPRSRTSPCRCANTRNCPKRRSSARVEETLDSVGLRQSSTASRPSSRAAWSSGPASRGP